MLKSASYNIFRHLDLIYTSCYCEENVYKLLELYKSSLSIQEGLKSLLQEHTTEMKNVNVIVEPFAVFLFNDLKQTHIRMQK